MNNTDNTGSPSRWANWPVALPTRRRVLRRIGSVALIVIAALLGANLYAYFFPPPLPLASKDVDIQIDEALAEITPVPAYSTFVYQAILPSLVFIQAIDETAPEDEQSSIGSGVVVNANGEILTSLHVVDDAETIEIFFADGTEATAEIIMAEPDQDIAMLQPSPPPELIVPAILGNPNAMQVGDEAYAVGNPLGLAGSMSAGVISGFERSIPLNDSDQRLEGLIQFDTAVNPGNSGGPLLNRQGQVIGIVTALANPSEQNFFVGIGFAVPIGTAVAAGGGGLAY